MAARAVVFDNIRKPLTNDWLGLKTDPVNELKRIKNRLDSFNLKPK